MNTIYHFSENSTFEMSIICLLISGAVLYHFRSVELRDANLRVFVAGSIIGLIGSAFSIASIILSELFDISSQLQLNLLTVILVAAFGLWHFRARRIYA